jgi:hypothetical protein
MMNPNHSNFVTCDDGALGLPGSDKENSQEDQSTERIQAFEECCTSAPAGSAAFLRIAVADLFRTIPQIERDVVGELREAFENPSEHKRPVLSRYIRTLRVLRQALQASVSLETRAQPTAATFQSQTTKQDQS